MAPYLARYLRHHLSFDCQTGRAGATRWEPFVKHLQQRQETGGPIHQDYHFPFRAQSPSSCSLSFTVSPSLPRPCRVFSGWERPMVGTDKVDRNASTMGPEGSRSSKDIVVKTQVQIGRGRSDGPKVCFMGSGSTISRFESVVPIRSRPYRGADSSRGSTYGIPSPAHVLDALTDTYTRSPR